MNRIKIAATLAAAAIALAACGGGGDKKVVPPQGAKEACIALYGGDIKNWTFSPLEKMAKNDCYIVQLAENQ